MVNCLDDLNFVDLHIHMGASVAPHILWRMAHEQGFRLPVNNYWEFKQLVTATYDKVENLDDYLKIMHEWTEKIQSSPLAVEQSVYEIISKEYRSSNVTLIELRFNPMKRNSGGHLDLDHIIQAAIRGMDRVCLEYGIQAGLIFCLAREFDYQSNEIIVEKAIRYRDRGILGIDLAGTELHRVEDDDELLANYGQLFSMARKQGLRTTIHTGETASSNPETVEKVISYIKPDRIGHGIRSAASENVMALLRQENITLEICPSSNLMTRAVQSIEELGKIISTLRNHEVPITINTDGSYLLETNMRKEFQLLTDNNILDRSMVEECLQTAAAASFIQGHRYAPHLDVHLTNQKEEE